MRRLNQLHAVVLLALACAPAAADEHATTEDQSLALRAQGAACYRRRQYRCALEKFARAFALRPTAEMRYNLASAEDKQGLAAAAINHYRAYLRDAGDQAPGHVLAHIQRRLQRLLPTVGQLVVQVQPGDASIATDDGIAGTAVAGTVEVALAPGRHRLHIVRAGFVSRSESIAIAAGERLPLRIALVQDVGHGSLSILTQPPGAAVWLDGHRQQRPTPVTLPRISEGWHALQLAAGTLCETRNVEIQRGIETRVETTLRAHLGRLDVSSVPAGASVWVDGRPANAWSMLPMGEHRITAAKPGFLPWSASVQLSCHDPHVRLTVKLAAAAVLRVGSTPPDARVRVDGHLVGKTPVRVVAGPGVRRLQLERRGYLPHDRQVTAVTERETELSVDLTPTPATAHDVRRRRQKTIAAAVSLALAGACAAAMGVLYGVGRSQGDDAYAQYRGATAEAARQRYADDVRSAEQMIIGGHALLGTSLAALGLSAYFFFSRPAMPPDAGAGEVSPVPPVSPAPSGLSLGGRF